MSHTVSQKMAQAAYVAVCRHVDGKALPEKYASFARSFPSLVHSCGLAQAIAFARAKDHGQYLDDLAGVLKTIGHDECSSMKGLERATRESPVPAYIRLSRNALQVASWLKRYVEATSPE